MPNINNAVALPFIPEIWANTALEILRNNIVLTRSSRRTPTSPVPSRSGRSSTSRTRAR